MTLAAMVLTSLQSVSASSGACSAFFWIKSARVSAPKWRTELVDIDSGPTDASVSQFFSALVTAQTDTMNAYAEQSKHNAIAAIMAAIAALSAVLSFVVHELANPPV